MTEIYLLADIFSSSGINKTLHCQIVQVYVFTHYGCSFDRIFHGVHSLNAHLIRHLVLPQPLVNI